MTHCAMLSGKYKRFIINDIVPFGMQLFCDAIGGKYKAESRWVTREEFFRLKDTDPYVRLCWSFGNRGDTYIYGEDIVDYKYCLHLAIVEGDYAPMKERYGLDLSDLDKWGGNLSERRKNIKKIFERYVINGDLIKSDSHYTFADKSTLLDVCEPRERLDRLNSLKNVSNIDQLQHQERNERLGCLESINHLERGSRLSALSELTPNEVLDLCQHRENTERVQSLEGKQIEHCQHRENTDRLTRLQNLERNDRIQGIKTASSPQIERHLGDYQDVLLPDDAVIICDIPYVGTGGYIDTSGNDIVFDHERFYDWVRGSDKLIFVCEYWMPDDFVCVSAKTRTSTFSATNNSLKKVEKLFIHKSKVDLYKPIQPSLFGFDF